MADEYFLWSNEERMFWKANAQGCTYCTHLAGRYTAERAVDYAGVSEFQLMVLRAPTPQDMQHSMDTARSVSTARKNGPGADVDPAFLIWDNNESFFLSTGPKSRHVYRAQRYTLEEARDLLKGNDRLYQPRYIPLTAPPPGAALAEFLAATQMEAA